MEEEKSLLQTKAPITPPPAIHNPKTEHKYQDIFTDIHEDKFDSSDDDVEKRKNERLERLSKVAAPHQKQQTSENTQEPMTMESKNILIGETGDILARYRIPAENNKVDYNLQLPEDSDSTNFSSDNEKNGEGDEKE